MLKLYPQKSFLSNGIFSSPAQLIAQLRFHYKIEWQYLTGVDRKFLFSFVPINCCSGSCNCKWSHLMRLIIESNEDYSIPIKTPKFGSKKVSVMVKINECAEELSAVNSRTTEVITGSISFGTWTEVFEWETLHAKGKGKNKSPLGETETDPKHQKKLLKMKEA